MRIKHLNKSLELREITGFFLIVRNKKTMRITPLVRIFGQEGLLLPYHLGNAVKYIARAGRKDPTKTEEDLRKAIWYINRYIEFLGKQKKGDRHVD